MRQSKALYNSANFLRKENVCKNYRELVNRKIPSNLPSWCHQQILKSVERDWSSFFALKKNGYDKSRPPNYKVKENQLIFTNQVGKWNVLLPKSLNLPLNCDENIREIRIIPYSRRRVELLTIYEKEDIPLKITGNVAWMDLWVANFATIVTPKWSYIAKWGSIKSELHFTRKQLAKAQSRAKHKKQLPLKRIEFVNKKKKEKVKNEIHKISRTIINQLVKDNVCEVIVGNNKHWKKNKRGKFKDFVQFPHSLFLQIFQYKCREAWIACIFVEESYTSKIDHLALEPMMHQEQYLWKRVHRWLFKSSTGKFINADVNGAFWMIRKKYWIIDIIDSYDLVKHPVRIY